MTYATSASQSVLSTHPICTEASARGNRRAAFVGPGGVLTFKWAASIVQVMGYSATAFGMTPLNIYLFVIGLICWFTVGVLWRDKAIMLIHIVALVAMIAGLIGSDL